MSYTLSIVANNEIECKTEKERDALYDTFKALFIKHGIADQGQSNLITGEKIPLTDPDGNVASYKTKVIKQLSSLPQH